MGGTLKQVESDREEARVTLENFLTSIANGKCSTFKEVQDAFEELEGNLQKEKTNNAETLEVNERLRNEIDGLKTNGTERKEQMELQSIKEELEKALKLNQELNESRSTLAPDVEIVKQEKMTLQEHIERLEDSLASVKEELEDTKILYEKALVLNNELSASNAEIEPLKTEVKGVRERLESKAVKQEAELGKLKQLYRKALEQNKALSESHKESLDAVQKE